MAKAKRPKDPMQLGKFIGQIATGDRLNDKADFLKKKPAKKTALKNKKK